MSFEVLKPASVAIAHGVIFELDKAGERVLRGSWGD